jgi:DNA-directed RNA polymerase specialized sigma24 family protein
MSNFKLIKTSADNILEQIREGDEGFLKSLYHQYRDRFITWFQKNKNLEKDEAAEIYQKAFTIFYFNVKDGKLTELNSEIVTYLFGVGKNLVKEVVRNQKQTVPLEDVAEYMSIDAEGYKNQDISHQKFLVDRLLQKVGEPCRSLLLLYYFRNFSCEAIAHNLGYKDALVVKKKKCLCLRKIREQLANEKNLLL